MLSYLLKRKKVNPYIYGKDTVFIALQKVAISAEDDISFLLKYLNGSLDNSPALEFVYRGIRSYNDNEYLVTLSGVDRELLENRLSQCESVRIV